MRIDGKQLCPHNMRIHIESGKPIKPMAKNYCKFCGQEINEMNMVMHESSIYCIGKNQVYTVSDSTSGLW